MVSKRFSPAAKRCREASRTLGVALVAALSSFAPAAAQSGPALAPLSRTVPRSGSDGDGPPSRGWRSAPEKTVLREDEFSEESLLAALPRQVVLLDLEAAEGPRENVFRYRLDAGTYNFCVGGELTRLTVEDRRGRQVADVDGQTGCERVSLRSGVYRMGAWHDGTAMTARGRVAFASVPARKPAISRCPPGFQGDYTKCRPKEGYFPLMIAESCSVNNGPPYLCNQQLLRAAPEPGWGCATLPAGTLSLKLDQGSLNVDEFALFHLREPYLSQSDATTGPRLLAQNLPLGLGGGACADDPAKSPVWAGNPPAGSANLFYKSAAGQDMGLYVWDGLDSKQYSLVLRAQGSFFRNGRNFDSDNSSDLRGIDGLRGSPVFFVPFRYLRDGADLEPLDEGEVALFQGCNYTGKTTVFVADTPDFPGLTSGETTLDKSTASVKLGPNTNVTLYSASGFTGDHVTLDLNTACLDSLNFTRRTSSIQVGNLSTILVDTRTCIDCDFHGSDLSGTMLSGVRLDGANLSGALLNGAILTNANLTGANMTGAFLNASSDGRFPPADLTGAQLKDVNLSGAQLAGAKFLHANFYGTKARASGATATGTIFTDAYLAGVDFSGATITGVHFENAVLVGAIFTNAVLNGSGQPAASGLFSAHLQGANLRGAKSITGLSFDDSFVDFTEDGNAMLILLDKSHTNFAGRAAPGAPVCVLAPYGTGSLLPETNSTMTCPDGTAASGYTPAGCGPSAAANTRWKSRIQIDQTMPPAWYLEDATYTKAATNPLCSTSNYDPNW